MAIPKEIQDIIDRLLDSQAFMREQQDIHKARVAKAVKSLQDSIINNMAALETKKGGQLLGMRMNIQNLQQLHKDINKMFLAEWDAEMRKLVTTFKAADLDVTRNYSMFGEDIEWTTANKETIAALKGADKRQYVLIGGQAKERVIQGLYDSVIGGKTMANLVDVITGAMTGMETVTGRPLSQYAALYANDMIMNYHQSLLMMKAEDMGMDRFLYYGGLISTSRDFCIRRVGKIYTKKEIDSWTFRWKGKRGGAYTYRGGWNCRHHWQPVRKEWMDKYKEDDLVEWFSRINKVAE